MRYQGSRAETARGPLERVEGHAWRVPLFMVHVIGGGGAKWRHAAWRDLLLSSLGEFAGKPAPDQDRYQDNHDQETDPADSQETPVVTQLVGGICGKKQSA